MPGSILFAIFGGMIAMTLMMALAPRLQWWKVTLLACLAGAAIVPMVLASLPFWPAFYAAWFCGVLLGSVPGALARDERLTPLLLLVSAALTAWPALIPYKSATNWQPPWNAQDVYTITVIEFFNLAIFTWLAAALLLLVLGLLIAGPVNLFAQRSPGGVRETVNTWFKERLDIVFGILGIISYVGSSQAEREQAKLRMGGFSPGPNAGRPRF